MYNWWIARSARELGPRLVCCCSEPFGPGRHDAVHARVGYGLAEMLAGDGDEGTAHGGLTVEHFLRLVGGGVMEGHEGMAKMPERIPQSFRTFGLSPESVLMTWGSKPAGGRYRSARSNAIIRRYDVRKHFAYGANACGRTPGVSLSRHGLG